MCAVAKLNFHRHFFMMILSFVAFITRTWIRKSLPSASSVLIVVYSAQMLSLLHFLSLLLRLWWTDGHVLSFNYTHNLTRVSSGTTGCKPLLVFSADFICFDDMLPEMRIPMGTVLTIQRKFGFNLHSFGFVEERVRFQIATLRALSKFTPWMSAACQRQWREVGPWDFKPLRSSIFISPFHARDCYIDCYIINKEMISADDAEKSHQETAAWIKGRKKKRWE